MRKINKSGPAFPAEHSAADGMTLRDYFAAKSLPICYQYWMHDFHHPDHSDAEDRSEWRNDFDNEVVELIADDAYEMAEAMLKRRKQC